MTSTLLSFATLLTLTALTLTATASAETYDATQPEPRRGTYLATGLSVGFQRSLRAGVQLEGAKRIGSSPLFVHGQLAAGRNLGGSYSQLRAGAEARTCAVREFFCAFAGADVGYQRDTVYSESSAWFGLGEPSDPYIVDAHDSILVPRAGVEAGRNIKVRALVEVPMWRRLDAAMDSDWRGSGTGLTMSLGVGYAF